jgi:hypothetical protein
MTSEKDIGAIRRLVLRRGAPQPPAMLEAVTEIRSNSVIKVPSPLPTDMTYALGALVIEWSFTVPLAQVNEFNSFLADHEALIAQSCEKLMKGVHYRGTYITTNGERLEYRTYWAYDSPEALKGWEAALANRKSNFVAAVQSLRSYWVQDPQGTQRHFSPGALYAKGFGSPFMALTLETAERMAIAGGRGAAFGAAKRGRGGKGGAKRAPRKSK